MVGVDERVRDAQALQVSARCDEVGLLHAPQPEELAENVPTASSEIPGVPFEVDAPAAMTYGS
jgi:hypothetical protein